jgi:biopolymer transport protein ExbD
MSKGKRRFGRKHKANQDMVLQITSMADIFTILLVFLLKSFSSGASDITPSNNMVLPEGQSLDPATDTIKLEIAQNMVTLDDKKITDLRQFQFDPVDIASNGLPKSLSAAFTHERQKDTLAQAPRIMVLADQGTPYGTLKTVLAAASYSGFDGFKLVVVENK